MADSLPGSPMGTSSDASSNQCKVMWQSVVAVVAIIAGLLLVAFLTRKPRPASSLPKGPVGPISPIPPSPPVGPSGPARPAGPVGPAGPAAARFVAPNSNYPRAPMSSASSPRTIQGPVVHVPQPAQLPEPFQGGSKFSAIQSSHHAANVHTDGTTDSQRAAARLPLSTPYMDFAAAPYEMFPTAGSVATSQAPAAPAAGGAADVDYKLLAQAVATEKPVMVMMYMNGCGPCNASKPAFHAAAQLARQQMGEQAPGFAMVERANAGPLLQQLNIQGFPTFICFHKGKPHAPYNGPREAEAIVRYLRQMMTASS